MEDTLLTVTRFLSSGDAIRCFGLANWPSRRSSLARLALSVRRLRSICGFFRNISRTFTLGLRIALLILNCVT